MEEKGKFSLEFEKPLRKLGEHLQHLQKMSDESQVNVSSEIQAIKDKISKLKEEIFSNLSGDVLHAVFL